MNDPHTATIVRRMDEEYERVREARSCELAERWSGETRVRLMFDPQNEVHPLYLELSDFEGRETFPVPSGSGLDALLHPFAYRP